MNWEWGREAIRAACYFFWAAGLYTTFLVAWTLWRRDRPKHAQKWMKFIASLKRFREKGSATIDRTWVTAVFFVSSSLLVYAMTRPPRFPVVEEHNVAVYQRLPDGDWLMSSDEQGRFAYRPCGDFDIEPMLSQAIGYVAPRARWEERGYCKSLRADNLNFWWRDEKGNYRRIQ